MDEEVLRSIDNKLDVLIKLFAGNLIQGKNKTEAILTLASFGVEANAIAAIVQTKPSTVYARLSEQKKKAASSKKKKKAEE